MRNFQRGVLEFLQAGSQTQASETTPRELAQQVRGVIGDAEARSSLR